MESCHERSTRYLLLNIELSNGALENGIHNQQDTFTGSTSQCAEYITHLKEDDLRVQPLRSVRVTLAMNPHWESHLVILVIHLFPLQFMK